MSAIPASNGETGLEKKIDEVKLETGAQNTTASSSVAASLSEKPTSGPLKTPIVQPAEGITAPPPVALTTEQQTKYESLLETAKSWKEIPSAKEKGGPVTDSEIMWLTRECLLRYLRATKWNTAEAAKRLLGTLTWRRDYGTEELTADYISPENETGKQLILGYDVAGRPCQYLNPGLQNTNAGPRQVQHLVYMVERSIEMMVPGQETLALLINFKTSKSRSNTAPGIGQGREVLNILQTHYPERLGRALIINVPWVVWGFFKLITPFIDPLTKEKLKFNDDMRQFVPPQQLWKEFQGDLDFEYDHSTYWPALNKLCEEKFAQRKELWIKGGKNYGESEIYLKGGNVASVGSSAPVVVSEENAQAVGATPEKVPETDAKAPVAAAPVSATS
ncbi:CRAL/TRIO [Glarea lozoyensis ATCC 20868]|uniref:CRAL/TRIO n=1 Tax=Glarea lozoyensis (strain ATCC 20868 / MF5171) TaxID=1116229 RepID=S3D844_GLAL2|nr:CRAL/TRIO [Glarea lozoyensis ATCC 20868]EPE34672.1 CRAL/TRIO [Glarea lozoyensis ATCC 20868]